jgi:hypothetical protein
MVSGSDMEIHNQQQLNDQHHDVVAIADTTIDDQRNDSSEARIRSSMSSRNVERARCVRFHANDSGSRRPESSVLDLPKIMILIYIAVSHIISSTFGSTALETC